MVFVHFRAHGIPRPLFSPWGIAYFEAPCKGSSLHPLDFNRGIPSGMLTSFHYRDPIV